MAQLDTFTGSNVPTFTCLKEIHSEEVTEVHTVTRK